MTVLKAAGCPGTQKRNSYGQLKLIHSLEYYCGDLPTVSGQGDATLEGASWVLEGFGKVGAEIARQFLQKGLRLVAVSTRSGALYNPEGLNIERLLELQSAVG